MVELFGPAKQSLLVHPTARALAHGGSNNALLLCQGHGTAGAVDRHLEVAVRAELQQHPSHFRIALLSGQIQWCGVSQEQGVGIRLALLHTAQKVSFQTRTSRNSASSSSVPGARGLPPGSGWSPLPHVQPALRWISWSRHQCLVRTRARSQLAAQQITWIKEGRLSCWPYVSFKKPGKGVLTQACEHATNNT